MSAQSSVPVPIRAVEAARAHVTSEAARVSVGVLLLSRVWVFLFAVVAFALFGADQSNSARYGSSPFAEPFGGSSDGVVSIWARWDSLWYLGIANSGYDFNADSVAFFPLYPLLSRIV